ncbi:hypothetical protein QEZ54_00455 [Catellatospora sp. KI3]|uniref:hypothetical protein n=1 Tax=Catellatospora sp. KI3 TaxID=3041620 RepID=UPI0024829BE0|nr:hypothetical protein [Catellatospora sp. KI3]MDI1459428.1 hypothetical protein [Catellatospora sp. KI3]
MLVTASGCDLFDGGPDTPPAPDQLTGLLAGTWTLIAAYDSALTALPELGPLLGPLRETHRQHADAITAIMDPRPSAQAFGPSSLAPAAGDRKAVLTSLRTAEQNGSRQAAEVCLATTPARATLVGEIAVARATHLEVLVP